MRELYLFLCFFFSFKSWLLKHAERSCIILWSIINLKFFSITSISYVVFLEPNIRVRVVCCPGILLFYNLIYAVVTYNCGYSYFPSTLEQTLTRFEVCICMTHTLSIKFSLSMPHPFYRVVRLFFNWKKNFYGNDCRSLIFVSVTVYDALLAIEGKIRLSSGREQLARGRSFTP